MRCAGANGSDVPKVALSSYITSVYLALTWIFLVLASCSSVGLDNPFKTKSDTVLVERKASEPVRQKPSPRPKPQPVAKPSGMALENKAGTEKEEQVKEPASENPYSIVNPF